MNLKHHAYLIERVTENNIEDILNFISKILDIKKDPHTSPNFLHIKSDQLNIEETEKIINFNYQKSFGQNGGGNKVILIEINNAGHQAQNALLKTLEEPSRDTYFLITISSASLLLPTIQSRVEIYNIKDFLKKFDNREIEEEITDGKEIDIFLKSNYADRLSIVKKMIDDESEDASSKLFQFLHDIEIRLKELENSKLGRRLAKEELKALVNAREYFADSGASKKLLLEYLSLKLPALK